MKGEVQDTILMVGISVEIDWIPDLDFSTVKSFQNKLRGEILSRSVFLKSNIVVDVEFECLMEVV